MSFSFPSPVGLKKPTKVFAKIYNVFHCSRKTEAAAVAESENGNIEKETQLDSVTVEGWQKGREEWFEALKAGDLAKVKDILSKDDIDINQTDENGWAGVHLASWNGYVEVLETLLGQGCDGNAPGPGGSSALALASQRGHQAVVRLLLQFHCEVNIKAVLADSMDVTPLHLAAQNGHLEIVKILVSSGAVVNTTMSCRGIKGVTPLHLAVEAGHLEIMDILIDAGCDVHSSTQPNSETPC